jgi:oxygen-dependent protoporphyrinogen oxidase
LGTLWDSSIFAKRAPDGKVLFRSMLGGASHPQVMDLDDQQIQYLVQKSLAVTMGINCEPELVQIYRHLQAIPEYRLGHKDLVAEIMRQADQYSGMFITGNAYFGVGINDCVEAAFSTAKSVIKSLNIKN